MHEHLDIPQLITRVEQFMTDMEPLLAKIKVGLIVKGECNSGIIQLLVNKDDQEE